MMPRVLTEAQRNEVIRQVKMILHAHRDCLRNLGTDTSTITYDYRDGYYGEVFGIMRALEILGYGNIVGSRESFDLKHWLEELKKEVLVEEHYGTTNECDFCVEHFGKDGAGRRRKGF